MDVPLESLNSPCKNCELYNSGDDFENVDLDGEYPSCSLYDDE